MDARPATPAAPEPARRRNSRRLISFRLDSSPRGPQLDSPLEQPQSLGTIHPHEPATRTGVLLLRRSTGPGGREERRCCETYRSSIGARGRRFALVLQPEISLKNGAGDRTRGTAAMPPVFHEHANGDLGIFIRSEADEPGMGWLVAVRL